MAAGLQSRGGTLFCVDTWQNETMPEGPRDTFATFLETIRPFRHHIKVVRKRSSEMQPEEVEHPLELVFIDADHSYEAVRADFEVVRPWLSSTATVAFHDVNAHPGVGRFVGELLQSESWALRGNVDSLVWIKRSRWLETPWLNPPAESAGCREPGGRW